MSDPASDIGFLDDDGYLYIVDRKKDMTISGGFNVYSSEVEHALMDIDGLPRTPIGKIDNEAPRDAAWAGMERET